MTVYSNYKRKSQAHRVTDLEECPDAFNIRAGLFHRLSEPMKNSNPTDKEVGGRTVIEIIRQSKVIFPGTCVGYGTSFIDGNTVLGYAIQPAAETVSELAHVVCAECEATARSPEMRGVCV